MNHLFFALRRSAHLGLAAMLVLAMAACAPADEGGTTTSSAPASAGEGGSDSGTATVADGAVEITAANLEFDANVIEAAAGEAFTITLVNDDSAPHNISVYTAEGGEEIVLGEVIEGGQTVEVEVPALDAGEYYFVCDVHPDMNGTVSVSG